MAAAALSAAPHGSSNLHTVFTSECNNKQFDWFSVGVYESFRTSGMQGSITRLLACDKEALAQYKGLDLGPTFVHPNYRHNPLNGDVSASYNKPASVMHFSTEANFTEEFILFIDADMLLTKPIDPVALGAKKGVVVSEYVPYMIGTSNGMEKEFLPEEAANRAKPVGWYHIFHRDDLKRIAPLWLKYCGRVRLEPERYWAINGSIPRNIPTGDAYVKFGKAPWISEMYGYAFGAAEAGVEHVITHGVVKYPGEVSNFGSEPYILHYGIDFTLSHDYNWNKMSYQKLDLFQCSGRYFGPPPAGRGTPRDKAMRFVVNTLNRAFCGFYHERCPHTPAAQRRCPALTRPAEAPCVGGEGSPGCCRDTNPTCWQWALDEQCEQNKAFMESTCKLSCGVCTPADVGGSAADGHAKALAHPAQGADPTHRALASLDEKLKAFAAASASPSASPVASPRGAGLTPHAGPSGSSGSKEVSGSSGATSSGGASGDGSAAAVAAAAAAAEVSHAQALVKGSEDSFAAAKAAAAKESVDSHAAAGARTEAAAREKAELAVHAAGALASHRAERAEAAAEVQAAAEKAQAPAEAKAHASPSVAASAADLAGQLGAQAKEHAPAASSPQHGHSPALGAAGAASTPTVKRSPSASAAPTRSLPAVGNAAYHDAKHDAKHHDAAAEIKDEFRRIAEAHASLYKPGHVPKWLERQEEAVGVNAGGHGQASTGSSRAPKASAPVGQAGVGGGRGIAPGTATHGARAPAGRLLPSDRVGGGSRDLAEVEEDKGHRWLLISLLGLWGSLIGVAAARYFRVFPFNGRKPRRGRPKDLMHRY